VHLQLHVTSHLQVHEVGTPDEDEETSSVRGDR